MTRRETIIELARTLRDVAPGPLSRKTGFHGTAESFSLEHSRLYRAGSYADLEAALREMRQPVTTLAGQMHNGYPTAMLARHFSQAHIVASRKSVPATLRASRLFAMLGQGWEPHKPTESLWMPLTGIYRTDPSGPGRITVELWPADTRHQLVNLAIDWFEQHLPDRLWLPDWDKLSEREQAA